MTKSPDSVRDSGLRLSEENPSHKASYSTDNDDENNDNGDNDCRTNATTVRASNLHSSLSLSIAYRDTQIEALIRRVLSHFPHPDDHAVMVSMFHGMFWNFAGDDRAEFLRSEWRLVSRGQDIDADLARELLNIRVDSRPLFNHYVDTIDREMTMTRSRQEFIDSDSPISENAGSGSACVQNTPFGDPGHDTADNDGATNDAAAVAAPAPTPEERAVAFPPGNVQDAGNVTLRRDPGVANLEGLSAQPAAAPRFPTLRLPRHLLTSH